MEFTPKLPQPSQPPTGSQQNATGVSPKSAHKGKHDETLLGNLSPLFGEFLNDAGIDQDQDRHHQVLAFNESSPLFPIHSEHFIDNAGASNVVQPPPAAEAFSWLNSEAASYPPKDAPLNYSQNYLPAAVIANTNALAVNRSVSLPPVVHQPTQKDSLNQSFKAYKEVRQLLLAFYKTPGLASQQPYLSRLLVDTFKSSADVLCTLCTECGIDPQIYVDNVNNHLNWVDSKMRGGQSGHRILDNAPDAELMAARLPDQPPRTTISHAAQILPQQIAITVPRPAIVNRTPTVIKITQPKLKPHPRSNPQSTPRKKCKYQRDPKNAYQSRRGIRFERLTPNTKTFLLNLHRYKDHKIKDKLLELLPFQSSRAVSRRHLEEFTLCGCAVLLHLHKENKDGLCHEVAMAFLERCARTTNNVAGLLRAEGLEDTLSTVVKYMIMNMDTPYALTDILYKAFNAVKASGNVCKTVTSSFGLTSLLNDERTARVLPKMTFQKFWDTRIAAALLNDALDEETST